MHTVRHLLFVIACVGLAVSAAAQRKGPQHLSEQSGRHHRVSVAAGIGLLPTFLKGGSQDELTVQASVQYALTNRIQVGVAYAHARTKARPFTDGKGVQTWSTNEVNHFGARLTGSIVRRGPFELYGGLQLGANVNRASYRHEFPQSPIIEDEEAYLRQRTNPFTIPAVQMSAIGFFGASLRVLPRVYTTLEIGNNLSLATAGLEFRL